MSLSISLFTKRKQAREIQVFFFSRKRRFIWEIPIVASLINFKPILFIIGNARNYNCLSIDFQADIVENWTSLPSPSINISRASNFSRNIKFWFTSEVVYSTLPSNETIRDRNNRAIRGHKGLYNLRREQQEQCILEGSRRQLVTAASLNVRRRVWRPIPYNATHHIASGCHFTVIDPSARDLAALPYNYSNLSFFSSLVDLNQLT